MSPSASASAGPDLAALPAPRADADPTLHAGPAIEECVGALREVVVAEVPLAERALEAGMRPAIFDAAEPDAVALGDPLAVFEVDGEVVALIAAGLA